MAKRKTHLEYVLELKKDRDNLTVIDEYINARTAIGHKCQIHNIKLSEKPYLVLKFGLPCCEERKRINWNTESWISESKKLYGKKFDYQNSSYIDSNKKIDLICPTHGSIKVNPGSHLKENLIKSGNINLGCPKCNQNEAKKVFTRSFFFEDKQEKICATCLLRKHINNFHKNKLKEDGYSIYCKQCKKLKAKASNDKVKIQKMEKFKKDNPGVLINTKKNFTLRKSFYFPETNEKICYKCKEKKSVTNFYISNKTDDGFDTYCKECHLLTQQNFYKKKYTSIENRTKEFLRNAKNNATKRKQVCSINKKDLLTIWKLQNKKCFYSGLEMILKPNDDLSVSLDRKDPNLGYIKNNIVFTINSINRIKSNYDIETFLEFCKVITLHRNNSYISKKAKIFDILNNVIIRSREKDKLNLQKRFNIQLHDLENAEISRFSPKSKKSFFFPETNEKLCGNCNVKKNIKDFWRHSGTLDGFHSYCKICCKLKQRQNENNKIDRIEYRIPKLLQSIKQTSKKRNILLNIDKNDLINQWQSQNENCYYSGIKMTIKPNYHHTLSIERIDSLRGYTADNIVFICATINNMKSNFELRYFFELCEKVTQNQLKTN